MDIGATFESTCSAPVKILQQKGNIINVCCKQGFTFCWPPEDLQKLKTSASSVLGRQLCLLFGVVKSNGANVRRVIALYLSRRVFNEWDTECSGSDQQPCQTDFTLYTSTVFKDEQL